MSNWDQNEEIQIFREYLRINTAQPDVDYKPAVEFLYRQAKRVNLPINVYYPSHPDRPLVVFTWKGTDSSLEAICLNSHMDTVPADENFWSYPPFDASIDEDGRIFARGTQDTKANGVQYLAAIRQLKQHGITLARTIYVTFAPDEEISTSTRGWPSFSVSNEFKAMNVGFCLDEGNATPDNILPIFYGERSIWRVEFKIVGTAGHGSQLFENTAGEKLYRILGKYLNFRNKEKQKLIDNPELTIGDVTSCNLTMINGGQQINVVPPFISAKFDMRIALNLPISDMEKEVQSWAIAGGEDIEIITLEKEPKTQSSPIDNIYANALFAAIKKSGFNYVTQMRPGGTDGRYIRRVGIPTLGFAPQPYTPMRFHANDEFLNADIYLKGIDVYKNVIVELGNAI